MSIEAHVIAIGPHDQSLAVHYEYAPANYEHIARGTEIVTQIGPCLETRCQSAELAELFGASIDDPSSWCLDARIDLHTVDPIMLDGLTMSAFAELRDAHTALSNAGFRFFLRVDR